MSEWKTYKLSEIAQMIGGGTPKTTVEEYWNGDIPWLSVVDFGKSAKTVYNTEKTITEKGLKESSTKILKKGQLIISARGTVGELAMLGRDMAFNQSCYGLTATKETTNEFLYYLVKDSVGRIKQNTHGAVFDTITKQTFENIEVTIPKSLEIQKEIAQILTSLDDKIELNLQMNQTLEAMAQALFREWFVNFNFPNFDGVLENGLPKGWRKCQVKDICEANSSTLNSKDTISEVHYIEISEVDRGMINNISVYKRGQEPSRAKRKLKHGDTVLSTVRPNRGSYFLSLLPNENLIASTGFAVFSPTKVPFSFLYIFLTNDDQLEFYGKMADGAAYPAINQSVIMNMEIILPTAESLERYQDVSSNLMIRIYENLEANKILTQTRDTLLPKLMRGQIEIRS